MNEKILILVWGHFCVILILRLRLHLNVVCLRTSIYNVAALVLSDMHARGTREKHTCRIWDLLLQQSKLDSFSLLSCFSHKTANIQNSLFFLHMYMRTIYIEE